MVAMSSDSTVAVQPGFQVSLADDQATQASIDRYLGSATRMLAIADLTWKVCVALLAVIVVAWALGVLPGAITLR